MVLMWLRPNDINIKVLLKQKTTPFSKFERSGFLELDSVYSAVAILLFLRSRNQYLVLLTK